MAVVHQILEILLASGQPVFIETRVLHWKPLPASHHAEEEEALAIRPDSFLRVDQSEQELIGCGGQLSHGGGNDRGTTMYRTAPKLYKPSGRSTPLERRISQTSRAAPWAGVVLPLLGAPMLSGRAP
jgi:hypothetical protein